jgi:hypothetical protein
MIDLFIAAVSTAAFFIYQNKENKTVVFILWILMVLSLVKIAENIDKSMKSIMEEIHSPYSLDEPGQFDPRIPIIRIYLDYENPQDTLLRDSILIYEREIPNKKLIDDLYRKVEK